jgi:hypothetical protein
MSNRDITLTVQFQSILGVRSVYTGRQRTLCGVPLFWVEVDQKWQATLIGSPAEIGIKLQNIRESGVDLEATGTLYVERGENDLLDFPLTRNGESYTFLFPLCAGMEGIRAIRDHIGQLTANRRSA